MRRYHRPLLALAAALLWPLACQIYDESLLVAGQEVSAGAGGTAGAGGSAGVGTSGGGQMSAAGSDTGGSPGAGGESGGEAGAGGTPTVPLELELIDDMEDGNNLVLLGTGRDGEWDVGWDMTKPGTIEPSVPFAMTELAADDRPGSFYAAKARGSGYDGTGWGGTLNLDMRQYGTTAYDASAYCGLHFWARRGDDSSPALSVRIADKNSMPAGGRCNEAVETERCFNHFYSPVGLTVQWREYVVLFKNMLQGDWGYQAPSASLESSEIYMFEFGWGASGITDVTLDDLSFIKMPESGSCDEL